MSDDNTPEENPGRVAAPPPPERPAPPSAPAAWPPAPERRPRRGGILAGVLLILIGGILLANQFFPWLGFEKLWPVILIVIGIWIMVRPRRRD